MSVKSRADREVQILKESNDHLVQQVNDLQEHNGKMVSWAAPGNPKSHLPETR